MNERETVAVTLRAAIILTRSVGTTAVCPFRPFPFSPLFSFGRQKRGEAVYIGRTCDAASVWCKLRQVQDPAGHSGGQGAVAVSKNAARPFASVLRFAFGGIVVPTTEERVIEIVSEQMGVSKDQITRDTSFINDLNADSLDTVELVMELEEEFEIAIPDEAAEKIQTVGQAIDYIDKELKAKQ